MQTFCIVFFVNISRKFVIYPDFLLFSRICLVFVIKNSLSFCFSFSLSFPYYLSTELRIVILEV